MATAALAFEDVGFAFPPMDGKCAVPLFSHLSLEVPEGAFCLLAGATGSGKTTLLRLAKPELAPVGIRTGAVRVLGHEVAELDAGTSARLVGYVFQDPDNQIVCDTVVHELAFGLENLGMPQTEMRRRLAEVCRFLGIEPWLHRPCAELSQGQRQVVALATVLVMRPQVLLLDEPTAMLDPVAEQSFLSLLFRTNRELGTTVVVATHAPERMAAYATCGLQLADGTARACEPGELVATGAVGISEDAATQSSRTAGDTGHIPPRDAISTTSLNDMRDNRCTSKDKASQQTGGDMLADDRQAASDSMYATHARGVPFSAHGAALLTLSGVWARYGHADSWVLRSCDLSLRPGEVRALLGGNGSGKSTLLAVAARVLRPRHGRVVVPHGVRVGLLPQAPKVILGCETLRDELMEWRDTAGYGEAEVEAVLARLGMEARSDQHPYDLSGGQQQLLALEKILLTRPGLVLLDEPTKGVDRMARASVARRIGLLAEHGAAVLVATHDRALVEACAPQVSLLFDGELSEPEDTADFLAASWMWR